MKLSSLKIKVFIFSLLLLFTSFRMQGLARSDITVISKYFNAFLDHVEANYFKQKNLKWSDFQYLSDRAKLLGYALGRQAANVKDIKVRREIFQRLENDMQIYLYELTNYLTSNLGVGAAASNKAWKIAVGAMMGFYDDEVAKMTGIDLDKVPNMFESNNPILNPGSNVGGVPDIDNLIARGYTSFREGAAMRIAQKVQNTLWNLDLHPLPGKPPFEFRDGGSIAL